MQNPRSNQEWIADLTRYESRQEQALEELRQLLLRAALYTLVTHHSELEGMPSEAKLAFAEECTQEALLAVLDHLEEFRGESKFTTWVYKFGVNTALSRARRWRWRQVSLEALAGDQDDYEWVIPATVERQDLEQQVRQQEVVEIVRETVRNELTLRQRQVLRMVAFEEIPMDVVVERLDSNRNAVYKLLHDARMKLKQQLMLQGYDLQEVMQLFERNS